MRIPKTTIIFSFIGAAFFVGLLYVSQAPPKRNRFLIPEGYSGSLAVKFSVRGAPPLPMEDGFRFIKFDKTGEVKTSSEGMPGKQRDEYFFYSGNSRRSLEPIELGGGFTEAHTERPDEFTLKFSVIPSRKIVPDRK